MPVLKAWADSLGTINYPLLSDFWPHGEIAKEYGVFREDDGFTERAIFVMDKEGIIQYIDIHDKDDQPDNEILFAELERIDPKAAEAMQEVEENPPELPRGGIVLYCDDWCPDCKMARAWLKKNNLDYQEVNVNAVPGAAEQVREWADGKLITPTFDIDGEIVLDFDVSRLKEILKGRLP